MHRICMDCMSMGPVSMKTITWQWDEGLARQHRGHALVQSLWRPPSLLHLRPEGISGWVKDEAAHCMTSTFSPLLLMSSFLWLRSQLAPGWIRADETFYSLRLPAVCVCARVCFWLQCVVVRAKASLRRYFAEIPAEPVLFTSAAQTCLNTLSSKYSVATL